MSGPMDFLARSTLRSDMIFQTGRLEPLVFHVRSGHARLADNLEAAPPNKEFYPKQGP